MADPKFLSEKKEAYTYLIDTVQNGKTHEFYKRTVELANKYTKLISGEGVDELLRQFVRREDVDQFEQRKRLTQAITPAVSASIMKPFYKVGRVNPVVNKITIGEKNEAAPADLKDAIDHYNGDKSILRYLEGRFVDLSFSDPNAFILTEFDAVPIGPQGQMVEKVKPRPFEVSSEQAVNYFYKNSILQWLIVKLDCKYKVDRNVKDGSSYTIYLPNVQIKFTPINPALYEYVQAESLIDIETQGGIVTVYRKSATELYLSEYFEHKAGRVQAFRIGYNRDLSTKGAIRVSPMHDAMCYFMKSIKVVSEFDLTMSLHAFAQKFQYVNRCVSSGCDAGMLPTGTPCQSCGGSGWAIHKSAQDAVLMRLPKNKEDMFPLEQMVHYERPPVDILEFQNLFITQLKQEAQQAVFNSQTFTKSDVAKTALEAGISVDNVYDTLFPFGEQWTKGYKYIASLVASFLDYPVIDVQYRLPKDFKFKSVTELLAELKSASDSNAPGYIRQEISSDISEQLFIDKPDELKRVRIKEKFNPFPGKTPTEIVFIISNGLTTEYNKVLWANFDAIFFNAENAQADPINFYDLEFTKQQEAIDAEVEALIVDIEADQPDAAVAFNDPNADPTAGGAA